MFKDLNPILHSQLRLAVISILISVKEAEFTYLREKTDATAGNLSVQINKLKEAGYIDVTKSFKDNYPQTIFKITPEGVKAFEEYVRDLLSCLNVKKYGAPVYEKQLGFALSQFHCQPLVAVDDPLQLIHAGVELRSTFDIVCIRTIS